ncbi:MAG TPA: acyl-CoA thioesterase [Coxiellaceae bacterium]|nr:MAG: hypothetical protein A3E81_02975 [Gammaproteobacteria bacterium RIFCSPHIGHO2_12_FULL_36_30]HLB56278.1 acyl-CoA thioesterase [Coxiellaceae bacterium]
MDIIIPEKFVYETKLDIHIAYINYGDHLGNDSFVVLLHEARIRFLNSLGYTERNLGGCGLIVKDLCIHYKKQVFHGDCLTVKIGINTLSKASVELVYVGQNREGQNVFEATTTIVFFDYEQKKIMKTPSFFNELLIK